MRMGLVILGLCLLGTVLAKPSDVLQPFLQYTKGSNLQIDQIRPFLESISQLSTEDHSLLNNATYVAYRRSQSKSIHLVLDTIVRSVENNLAEVDAYFAALKDNFRRERSAEFARLERETAEGVAKDKEIDDLVEAKEAEKIKMDKAYGAAQGELEAQKLVVQNIKHEEILGKLKADKQYKRDIAPIMEAHNESREMFLDELMFIAKIRQMVEKMNADYTHDKGSTAHPTPSTALGTHAPTKPPTLAPTFADMYNHRFETPQPTAAPTPSPTTYLASCAAIKVANPSTASGYQQIQTPTGAFVQAFCDYETDGGAYTIVKCDDFAGGACSETSGNDGKDTCSVNGLQMLVPKSKAHWTSLVKNGGDDYLTIIPGVSKPNSGKGINNCVMRSREGHPSTKLKKSCSGFRSVDAGSWWVRDEYWPEPNENYVADRWLCLDPVTDVNYITFNDDSACRATKYLCSTNDYDPTK